jgi:hypothetical protein
VHTSADLILIARFSSVLLAIAELAILIGYVRYLLKFPKSSRNRALACLIAIPAILVLMVVQLRLYEKITHTQHALDDKFVFALGICQNIVAVVIVFHSAIKMRANRSDLTIDSK